MSLIKQIFIKLFLFRTGYKILNELLKKPQHLRFIIHLMKVIQPADYKADSWQMNNTQKLERLEKIRLEGNNLFKKVIKVLLFLDTQIIKENNSLFYFL